MLKFKIIELLKKNPNRPFGNKAIHRALPQFVSGSVDDALATLHERGQIIRIKKGIYLYSRKACNDAPV